MSEVLKRGLPVLQRFAGLGKYLPKGAIRNNAYAAALFTPLDVAGNFMEGKNPIRAVGRPLFQLGGGIGGGMLGGALGIPSGPGLAATAVAGGTGGYYGGGALFDQVFPERDSNLGKDALRLAALTTPMGGAILSHLNKPSPAQSKETFSNVKAARTSPGKWFGLPDLGITEMFSTKDPSQVRVGDANFQQAKTRLAGDTDITSGTGMANVPVTEGSGTKLIQTENGTVMRVPVDQDLSGSTTIQTDLEPKENEINYDIIPKEESIRQGETAKAKWLYDTRNSPAARAGVFSDDERWALQQKDRDFQESKRTGTLDEFAKKYPNSQTAKRRNWNPRMGRRS